MQHHREHHHWQQHELCLAQHLSMPAWTPAQLPLLGAGWAEALPLPVLTTEETNADSAL